MPQIIIIEDNPSLLSILSMGLKRYTGVEPFPREDAEDAISLLKVLPKIDLIITKNTLPNENTAKILANFITENNLSTKLVVNGPMEKIFPYYVVENSGDFEQILYFAFKAMGIPLEEIQKKRKKNYVSLKSSQLVYVHTFPCDVYLKLKKPDGNDFYLRSYHLGDSNKADSILGFMAQGVTEFFILENDEISILNVLSDSLIKNLESHLNLDQRLKSMDDAFDFFSRTVIKFGLISASSQVYDALLYSIKTLMEEHHFIPTIYAEVEKSEFGYNFKNFINLSGTFHLMAKQNFLGLDKELEKMIGVALFHDVKLLEGDAIVFTIEELKLAKLGEIREEIILGHARDAAEILSGEKDFPLDMAKIIREHHGDISGLGFPNPPKESISLLAKIFIATERILKELLESKDTPDIRKVKKEFTEDIYHKVIDKLFFIFSGGV